MATSDQATEKNFETSIQRLEAILETMNKEALPLEESLKLYEEADRLISFCEKKLNESEQRVEVLIKNRQGEVTVQDNGNPLTEAFPF